MSVSSPDTMTVTELSARLGIKGNAIARWVRSGRIPPDCVLVAENRPGGRLVFRRARVEEWLSGQSTQQN